MIASSSFTYSSQNRASLFRVAWSADSQFVAGWMWIDAFGLPGHPKYANLAVWKPGAGRVLVDVNCGSTAITSAVFSADSRHVLTSTGEPTIYSRTVEAEPKLTKLPQPRGVDRLELLQDGRILAFDLEESKISWWDVTDEVVKK